VKLSSVGKRVRGALVGSMGSTLATAAALALAGCGGSDSTPEENGKTIGSGGGTHTGGTAACDIDSGYEGDELCILPPDPSEGFQLHYGPGNYDDPAQVNPYLLQPGEELVDCLYLHTTNETEKYFYGFHSRLRPGSHHLIVTAIKDDREDVLGDCEGGGLMGGAIAGLAGAQTPIRDFPEASGDAPENAGLGKKLPARAQASMQLHFVNTGTEPILREAWVNVMYKDAAEVTQSVSTVAHIGGIGMAVQPNTTEVLKFQADVPKDLRVVDLFGHFHAHTTRFSAWKVSSGGERQLVYEAYDWEDPGNLSYNSVYKNGTPDPVARTPGGYTGILEFSPGDRVEWECEIKNDSEGVLNFANEVYTAEMCNLFGSHTPGTGGWVSVN
jgi:hypothetical protein